MNERSQLDKQAGKYLTFRLGNEEYALGVLQIQEIVGMSPIRAVPRLPAYILGVMNLRGQVIPVMDLRLRLGQERRDPDQRTCIVVTEMQSRRMLRCWEEKQCGKKDCPAYENPDRRCWMISATHCRGEIQGTYLQKIEACRLCNLYQDAHRIAAVTRVGLMVDEVAEVVVLSEEDIGPIPEGMSLGHDSYLLGIAQSQGRVRLLLDSSSLLEGGSQLERRAA